MCQLQVGWLIESLDSNKIGASLHKDITSRSETQALQKHSYCIVTAKLDNLVRSIALSAVDYEIVIPIIMLFERSKPK